MPSDDAPPAKRARTADTQVPGGLCAFNHVMDWYELNKESFAPPVCNKLMHRGQISVMFVGGPNKREDFHLEEGSEFFFQLKGDMQLPTVQNGKRKLVEIKEGQVFCLPSRIPHSPQRPQEGSLGLVIERCRIEKELDGLVYYTDFTKCEEVLWERFFRCDDLGTDLPPVVRAFKESEEFKTKRPGENVLEEDKRPVKQDRTTEVPSPFLLADFLSANKEKLECGEVLPLFGGDHPCKEFTVLVAGGPSEQPSQTWPGETWLYQLRGTAHVAMAGGTLALEEGCSVVVQPGQVHDVVRAAGSVGLLVRMDPRGNKPAAASQS